VAWAAQTKDSALEAKATSGGHPFEAPPAAVAAGPDVGAVDATQAVAHHPADDAGPIQDPPEHIVEAAMVL